MRRFPAPWTVEALEGGFKVIDANKQAIAYVYGHADKRDAEVAFDRCPASQLKMHWWRVALTCVALSGCYREEWKGFVYPSRDNLLNHREIGTYSSLEQCRSAALAVISNAHWTNADYECGLNCQMSDTGSGLNICEKTER
jgi:hypothetical protein